MRACLVALMGLIAVSAQAETLPAPGDRFYVDPAALPAPYATSSAAAPADIIARPTGAGLTVPPGYQARLTAEGLDHPRNLLVLPDQSVLAAEQRADKLTVLGRDGKSRLFADGFDQPFGLAFHAGEIWVADLKAVWALSWPDGKRRRQITPDGSLGDAGGHATRSLAIHPDGTKFYVGIGSRRNIAEEAPPRASILEFPITGGQGRVFASGLRNPVGMAFRPGTSELWAVVNERDGLGDELVPDYLTRVEDGAFYGWPYAYIGAHPQPDFAPLNPAKVAAARVPDVLFRAHSAPLGLAFYQGDAVIGLHGSWNRSSPMGYFVARVPFKDGRAAGGYQVFAAGFALPGRAVWGRPVGIAVGPDGAIYVADDAGRSVWEITQSGK